MNKNKKCLMYISLIITVGVGIIFGMYSGTNSWGDIVHGEIKNIDWVTIGTAIFETFVVLYVIIYFLFSQKKAGRKMFKLSAYNYKTQFKILIFQLVILMGELALFIYSPSISGFCMTYIIMSLFLLIILYAYVMNGLYENGLIYFGKFWTFEEVISYSVSESNLIVFKLIEKGRGSIELKYLLKENNCNEILEEIEGLINNKS